MQFYLLDLCRCGRAVCDACSRNRVARPKQNLPSAVKVRESPEHRCFRVLLKPLPSKPQKKFDSIGVENASQDEQRTRVCDFCYVPSPSTALPRGKPRPAPPKATPEGRQALPPEPKV